LNSLHALFLQPFTSLCFEFFIELTALLEVFKILLFRVLLGASFVQGELRVGADRVGVLLAVGFYLCVCFLGVGVVELVLDWKRREMEGEEREVTWRDGEIG
jgi:hypothetical protein